LLMLPEGVSQRQLISNRSVEPPVQHVLHLRPLFADDAVPGTVATGAIGHDEVIAKKPLINAANRTNGRLGALVAIMGLEADAEQAERLEGIAELQELRFGIDAHAANAIHEPGIA